MIIEYTHPELGEDIQGRAGFYTAVEELTMPYKGREILYVMGTARLDRPCCGGACSWGYVQVPGFLVRRHVRRDDSGLPVSEVEIVEDEDDRNRIRQALMDRHPGAQVEIWGKQYAQEGSAQTSPRPAP
ncbi:MAG: hypothetical protein QUS33_09915 [Dehalococcoidia bacterium]|nr:hypothetical protein [Dehalococcoidia bacterium]